MASSLPLLGAPPRLVVDALPLVSDDILPRFAAPSVALVAVEQGVIEGACAAFREALRERSRASRELHVRVAKGAARLAEFPEGILVEGPLVELHPLIEQASAGLDERARLLVTGPAVLALRRPRVAVLVTSAIPRSEWGPDVRSVRSRFDLVVPSLDVSLARELVDALEHR